MKTAILVDGGFYKKRAKRLFGEKSPKQRANEMVEYCLRHLRYDVKDKNNENYLYRIFYYDCYPLNKTVFHPLTGKSVNLEKTELFSWSNDFLKELCSKRKVALRMGEILESTAGYIIKPETTKKLCRKQISIDELTENDFTLSIQQKGVDMKIGLDISSLAYKKQVDRIVLIAGDSDFVPAAKHARREGIDFILDPMWHTIKPSLNEHIDGLHTCTPREGENHNDRLFIIGKHEPNLKEQ